MGMWFFAMPRNFEERQVYVNTPEGRTRQGWFTGHGTVNGGLPTGEGTVSGQTGGYPSYYYIHAHEWENGYAQGTATIVWSSGPRIRAGTNWRLNPIEFNVQQFYEGQVSYSIPHGRGTLHTFSSAFNPHTMSESAIVHTSFHGDFLNGNMHGEGNMRFSGHQMRMIDTARGEDLETRRISSGHLENTTAVFSSMEQWLWRLGDIAYSTDTYGIPVEFDNGDFVRFGVINEVRRGFSGRYGGVFEIDIRNFPPYSGRMSHRGTITLSRLPMSNAQTATPYITFEGDLDALLRPDGRGVVHWDGMQFSGIFVEGLPQGQGTLIFPSGHEVSGIWDGDMLNGVIHGRQLLDDGIFDGPILPRTLGQGVYGMFITNSGASSLARLTYLGNESVNWEAI